MDRLDFVYQTLGTPCAGIACSAALSSWRRSPNHHLLDSTVRPSPCCSLPVPGCCCSSPVVVDRRGSEDSPRSSPRLQYGIGGFRFWTLQDRPCGSVLHLLPVLCHGQFASCSSRSYPLHVIKFDDSTFFLLMGKCLGQHDGAEKTFFENNFADETTDLWLTAKKVGGQLEHYHKASSLTFTIQDGPQAGQTVPHVHIHILPRKAGDFKENDEIYDAIDEKEKELKQKVNLDKERKDRSFEELAQEAGEYRKLFL
ncbi:hypothetical protein NL676_012205 [Syzygium grande]|nr:hypothetical protein NL676_012205 [Syzygium grande]